MALFGRIHRAQYCRSHFRLGPCLRRPISLLHSPTQKDDALSGKPCQLRPHTPRHRRQETRSLLRSTTKCSSVSQRSRPPLNIPPTSCRLRETANTIRRITSTLTTVAIHLDRCIPCLAAPPTKPVRFRLCCPHETLMPRWTCRLTYVHSNSSFPSFIPAVTSNASR